MKGKGYASVAQVSSADVALKQAATTEATARTTRDLFHKFGAPKQIGILEAQVQSDQADLIYCQRRLTRYDERLAYYKLMVDNCTIRAPHDGFVIYVPPRLWTSEPPIEAGSRVRQMQDLFYLPDLARMRVSATLHESIVRRVQPGMRVRARIEGIGGREVEGHVLAVEPLPDMQMSWISDTRSFKATVALDASPRGLRPEMTAEVEIDVDRHDNVIAVPVEAVAVEDGRDYCYVAADGMLFRRPVKLGGSNPDLLEITEGLDEGEEVVSDVSRIDAYAPLIVDAPDAPRDEPRPAWTTGEKLHEAGKVGL
jgi:HlyD family secretion protein